jgi:DNA polymerase III subunit delta'
MYNWHQKTLSQLLARRSRLPHALLLHAPAGTGIAEFGAWLSQSLLCEQPRPSGEACGACAACNWFSQGNHPDFRLVQPESFAADPEEGSEAPPDRKASERKSDQIRIDQIRALADFLSVGTHRSGARVLLLHPADSMNMATQNALLKNLEEPGAGTVFLLATSLPDRLLPTIRSRCQAVPLPRPDAADSLAWLRSQGVADPDELLAMAGGAPLAAAEMAAQTAFFAQLADRLADRRLDPLSLAQALQSVPAAEVVNELYRWCYDLLTSRLGGTVRYHVKRQAALEATARHCDPVRVAGYLRKLCEARSLAQHPLNPRLFMEDLLLQYSQATKPA